MKPSPKAIALRALLAYATGTDTLPTYEAPGPRHPHGKEVAPHWQVALETAVPRRDLLTTDRDREVAATYGLDLDAPDESTTIISRAWAGTPERPTDTSETAYQGWLQLHAARIPDPWMPVAIAAHGQWHRLDDALIDAMRARGDVITGPEAAQIAGVTASTWRRYRSRHLTPDPVDKTATGQLLWSRTEVETWQANRPGKGARTDLY